MGKKLPLTNKVIYKRLSFLNFLVPILLAFLVSSLFCVIDGSNPFEVYRRIFATAFLTKTGWMNTLGSVSYTHLTLPTKA